MIRYELTTEISRYVIELQASSNQSVKRCTADIIYRRRAMAAMAPIPIPATLLAAPV